jgi:hypothetical protein
VPPKKKPDPFHPDLERTTMTMRPRDLFSVGLRLFGVWMGLRGFDYIVNVISIRLGLTPSSTGFALNQHAEELWYLFYASADITIGVCLILGAEQFADFAFRLGKKSAEQQSEEKTTSPANEPDVP